MPGEYKFLLTGASDTGAQVQDTSGAGNHATLGAGLSEATVWANDGYFSTAGDVGSLVTDGAVELAPGVADFELDDGDKLLLAFTINKAQPAYANDAIMGSSYSTGNGAGFRIATRQNEGTLTIGVYGASTAVNNNTYDEEICDGTDKKIVLAVDGTTKAIFLWVDGLLDLDGLSVAAATTTSDGGEPFCFGHDSDDRADRTWVGQWKNVHGVKFAGEGLPMDIDAWVAAYSARPAEKIATFESGPLKTRAKSICAVMIGQSNEQGHRWSSYIDGATVGDRQITTYGCPTRDIIRREGKDKGAGGSPDSGEAGSWWPGAFSEAAKRAGYWINPRNECYGGTSWIEDFCGTAGSGSSAVPLGKDDVGWDPNSYLADAKSWLTDNAANYDEVHVYMSNGQADASRDTDQAQYEASIANIIEYFTFDTAAIVYVGLSSLATTSQAVQDWYEEKGNPAIASVLATNAANAQVQTGANLYTGIQNPGVPDNSHLDVKSYMASEKLWAEAIAPTSLTVVDPSNQVDSGTG